MIAYHRQICRHENMTSKIREALENLTPKKLKKGTIKSWLDENADLLKQKHEAGVTFQTMADTLTKAGLTCSEPTLRAWFRNNRKTVRTKKAQGQSNTEPTGITSSTEPKSLPQPDQLKTNSDDSPPLKKAISSEFQNPLD